MKWPLVKLSELMSGRGTSVDPSRFPDEEFALFSVPAYDSQIPDRALGKEIGSSKQRVEPGDILLSKIVPHIRRAWIVPEADDRRQIGSSEWIIFRSSKLYAPYMRHVLLSDQFNAKLMRTVSGVGGSLLRARPESVARLEIPLPPLKEQKRIAALLDKAEEVIAKRRAAIALLDQLPQSLFLEMFGDPKKNPMGFALATFGQVIMEMRGGANLAPEDFIDDGFPILHKGAIRSNGRIMLDTNKKTFVSEQFASYHPRNHVDRDFLAVTLRDLVPTGPAIGFIADLKSGPYDHYVLSQGAYAFKADPKQVTSQYLVVLSNMPTFRHVLRQNAVGSTQIHIRTPIFQAITFPLPPIQAQIIFEKRIEEINRAKAAHRCALEKLDALFAIIQARAFIVSVKTAKVLSDV